jgi:carnitine-CoA ligase
MSSLPACAVPELLAMQADARPGAHAIEFVGGDAWTFAQLHLKARELAASLQQLGVQQDDFVLSWQPSGPLAVLTFLALNCLGAVYVPINTSYRGAVLQHVLRNSAATLMIAHGELLGRLTELDCGALKAIVVVGPERLALGGIELLDRGNLTGTADRLRPPLRAIAPWDTHMVIYTSGTTGPSKGVLSSYLHTYTAAREFRHVGPGDRVYNALPMFHVGGPYAVLFCLIHGITAVMDESFRTTEFWARIDHYRITTTGLLGSMAAFLLSQPPAARDRQHCLRKVIVAPLDPSSLGFAERFGVTVFAEYNMSELSVPLFSDPNPVTPGLCGKARPGVELRLVDGHDIEVPDGSAGELLIRARDPWTLSHGYHRNAEATAAAWRNGWFHSGDLFRRAADGNYFFIDRIKDVLRRRGENISSFEVESAILLHPSVHEAAVVAVPGEQGEDDVLAVVRLKPGHAFDPGALFAFLEPRLPHFMLPRHIRCVAEMPQTPTHKIEKHRLRAAGLTADTWDREQAGLRVKRDSLERRS